MRVFGSPYDDLCKKAVKAGDAGDLEKSCDFFLKAIQIDSQKPLAFAGLGLTYQKVAGYFPPDNSARREYGEMSLKALDEATRLQPRPDAKAEYLWLKGVTLTLLGQVSDADASWSLADKLQPGSVEKRRTASRWLTKRTCKTCGKTFTLYDHGHVGAWAAAEAEERDDGEDNRCDYFALRECPTCKEVTVTAVLEEAILSVEQEAKKKASSASADRKASHSRPREVK